MDPDGNSTIKQGKNGILRPALNRAILLVRFRIGLSAETDLIVHRVLVPIGLNGELTWLANEGYYTILEPIARIKTDTAEVEVSMCNVAGETSPSLVEQLQKNEPLVTDNEFSIVSFQWSREVQLLYRVGLAQGKQLPNTKLRMV